MWTSNPPRDLRVDRDKNRVIADKRDKIVSDRRIKKRISLFKRDKLLLTSVLRNAFRFAGPGRIERTEDPQ
jgi:hypothetical protein